MTKLCRNKHSLWKQLQVELDYEDLLNENDNVIITAKQKRIAKKYGIHRTQVHRWHKKKDKLFKKAAKCSKLQLKNCYRLGDKRLSQFPVQEAQLKVIFKERRKKGKKINDLWIKLQFKRILKKDKPNKYEQFKYSNGWLEGFKKRYSIVLRKRTNKKDIPIENRKGPIQQFHILLHNIRNTNHYKHQSKVYGRFAPSNTYTFDEIPMPFVFGWDSTLEEKGAVRVYIKQCGKGLCYIHFFL